MPLNVPVFFTRLASSVVFVAVMLTGLLWHDRAFVILICLINILCLREYFILLQKMEPDTYWPEWLPNVVQVTSLIIIIPCYRKEAFMEFTYIFWTALPLIPVLLLLVSIMSKRISLFAVLQALGGLLYITLPMIMLLFMRLHSFIFPLALICLIWSNDTMAYLVGSFFGKTQFSAISPKKTWEGTLGGALVTIIAAVLFGHFSHIFRIADWAILALCATVAGTMGDLMESKLKRMAEVKDSGALMPGHGGALDRFDSLLIATPFAFAYVIYFMPV